VALKNLELGFILVTGPYAINGVPLKRVNAAYVIATSTKVSLDGVTANVDKSFFTRRVRYTKHHLKNASDARTKKSEGGKVGEAEWKAKAKKTQEIVDEKLVLNIKKVP
jgi:large subunit ribosomal protein L6e